MFLSIFKLAVLLGACNTRRGKSEGSNVRALNFLSKLDQQIVKDGPLLYKFLALHHMLASAFRTPRFRKLPRMTIAASWDFGFRATNSELRMILVSMPQNQLELIPVLLTGPKAVLECFHVSSDYSNLGLAAHHKCGNSNHCQPAIIELLCLQIILLLGICRQCIGMNEPCSMMYCSQ